MGKVTSHQFGNNVDASVMLRQLADDSDLKGCVIVCSWHNCKQMTVGWSTQPPEDMLLSAEFIKEKAVSWAKGE